MIQITVKTLSPLSHGSFGADAGNAQLVRRMPIAGLPGMPEVPVLSGNALRAVCRRIVMRDLFDACGISAESMPARDYQRLYAALANGGHLDGAGQKSVDTDAVRALRASLPALSTFGAALYTWQLTGRMKSTFLWPHSTETHAAGLAPDDGGGVSAEELVIEVSHTRHIEREHHQPEVSGVTPMPVTIEALAAGVTLSGRILFEGRGELERSVVAYALDRIRILGGKSGSGFGRVDVAHDGDAAPYEAWMSEHAEAAGAALRALAGTL